MSSSLLLVSHKLCPYVQRAVISLTEKQVPFERVDVDLSNKPDWFKALSPLGKTPVLKVGTSAIFESAVILEYLEETQQKPLHPKDPLKRAEHRAAIEFGSTILSDIWGFYAASAEAAFEAKRQLLAERFAWIEKRLDGGPWFGERSFRSSMPLSGRCFAISTSSTSSMISASWRKNRRSRTGARTLRRALPSAVR
jgi:glutathione S-transferase